MELSRTTKLEQNSEQGNSGSVSNGMNDSIAQKNISPTFGFWLYLMSDCLLFAALFATYAVLHGNTFGGPSIADFANLPYVLVETLFLLT